VSQDVHGHNAGCEVDYVKNKDRRIVYCVHCALSEAQIIYTVTMFQ
jgi:hypothetical protein